MDNNTTKAPALVIYYDQQTCSRCLGSGRFSYNQITGDRCFKCGGSGTVDTRDGAKARAAILAKREELYGRAIEDVKVGETAKLPGAAMFARARWAVVTESRADDLNPGFWLLRGQHSGLGGHRSHRIHVHTPAAGAAVLAFAATLKGCTVGPKKAAQ